MAGGATSSCPSVHRLPGVEEGNHHCRGLLWKPVVAGRAPSDVSERRRMGCQLNMCSLSFSHSSPPVCPLPCSEGEEVSTDPKHVVLANLQEERDRLDSLQSDEPLNSAPLSTASPLHVFLAKTGRRVSTCVCVRLFVCAPHTLTLTLAISSVQIRKDSNYVKQWCSPHNSG
jgi:hypothetical protein